jgi:hypothetical protein
MDNMRGGARYWGTFDPPSVGSEDVNVRSWHLANNPAAVRDGPGCLNRFSASISGASAGVRLPSGGAAA